MKNLSVAIIIIGFNNEKSIRECLYSLFKNFLGKNFLKGRIIFIDNNSSDKTVENVSKLREFYPYFDVVKNEKNIGFSKAVNQGIIFAQKKYDPDFFMLLNPDAKLETETLVHKTVQRMMKFSKPVIASPRITKAYNEECPIKTKEKKIWFEGGKINWLKQKVTHEKFNSDILNNDKIFQSDFISGCAMLFNRKTLTEVGLFDERFFLFYEDADFCFRAKKHGAKLIVFNDLEVCHIESASFSNQDTKNYHLVKSGLFFFHKHSAWWNKTFFWIKFYLRFFYHRFFSKKIIVLKAMKNFKEEIR